MQVRQSELEVESVALQVKLTRSLDELVTREGELEHTHNACTHALETHQSMGDKLRRELKASQLRYVALGKELDQLLAEVHQKNKGKMEFEALVELMHGENEHLRSSRDDLLVQLEDQTDKTVASEAALFEAINLRSVRDEPLVELEGQTHVEVARVGAKGGLHDGNNTLWEDLATKNNHTRGYP